MTQFARNNRPDAQVKLGERRVQFRRGQIYSMLRIGRCDCLERLLLGTQAPVQCARKSTPPLGQSFARAARLFTAGFSQLA
jgi:hypothetical protein